MPLHDRIAIRWSSRDPEAVAAQWRGYGFTVAADRRIVFPSATMEIEAGTAGEDRLAFRDDPEPRAGPARPHANGIADVLAIGWATVDRERFAGDARSGPLQALPDDPHLGAFVVRQGTGRPYALVLEPETEGRLAASLVRFGEGPAAVYLRCGPGGLAAFVDDARRRGSAVSVIRSGPLGPSVLLLGGPAWGPHVLVVEAPADVLAEVPPPGTIAG
jgi:hypothetical protein